MTLKRGLLTLAAITLGGSTLSAAADTPATGFGGLQVDGRTQLFGFAQQVDDPSRNDARLYLFLKQARLNFSGSTENTAYHIELAYAGEDEVRAPSPGVSLNLLDYSFDVKVPGAEGTSVRLGQFKVPYGREGLTNSGRLQFAGRSIQHLGFRMGRDVGAAVSTRSGNVNVVAGLFAGGGRDVPERYLPQTLGIPLVALRVGLDTGVDDQPYSLGETAGEATADDGQTAWALHVNGVFMRDSLVGHSTVFNVKTADKSLVVNSKWNPFIGQRPLTQGDFWMAGADTALRMPLTDALTLSAEVEINHANYENEYGTISLTGGRAQVGVHGAVVDLGLRYAFLNPDDTFAAGGVPITGGGMIHEVTPALTYYLGHDRNSKLVLDLPILLDVPVVTELGVGAYVLTEQPDQTSVLADEGTVGRQNVIEARMLIQMAF